MAEEESTGGEFRPVEFDDIRVGDRVRGRFEDSGDVGDWTEGVVSEVQRGMGLRYEGSIYLYDTTRTWQRFTTTTEETAEFRPIEPTALAVGMWVRGTRRDGVSEPHWPHVVAGVVEYVDVSADGNGRVKLVSQARTYSTRLRTWEHRVPAGAAPTEGRWEPIDSRELVVGSRARGVPRINGDTVEGVVEVVSAQGYVKLDTSAGRLSPARTWYRWVPTQAAPAVAETGAWVDAEVGEFAVGDRIRVTHRRSGTVQEGVVHREENELGYIVVTITEADGYERRESFHSDYRTWQRWVPASEAPDPAFEPVTPEQISVGDYVRGVDSGRNPWTPLPVEGVVQQIDVENDGIRIEGDYDQHGIRELAARNWTRRVTAPVTATPEPAPLSRTVLAAPQVGDRFNRMYAEGGRRPRRNCEVIDVRPRTVGGWRVSYNYDGATRYGIDVREDGTIDHYLAGRYEPIVTPEQLASRPNPFAPIPAGTVLATEPAPTEHRVRATRDNLRVGDIVLATPGGIGGLMRAEVTDVDVDTFGARTIEVVRESSNGRRIDMAGTYFYNFDDDPHPLILRNPGAPTPAPVESPLPEWAVGKTLEEARKHIHDEARRLYRRGSNCYSGTRDFLSAAGLPADPDRAYPEPTQVDESEQVRAFLAKVRTDALATASDHGKSMREVEGYLAAIGLTAPRPTHEDHTVNVRVPAGANVTQVLRDLGWEVR